MSDLTHALTDEELAHLPRRSLAERLGVDEQEYREILAIEPDRAHCCAVADYGEGVALRALRS